jgi:hypothetical protein
MSETAALAELLASFMSLGSNCELGVVQYYCGVEPLDLLRFGWVPFAGLIGQLDAAFAAFANPDKMVIGPDQFGFEYMLREPTSGIRLHTGQRVSEIAVDTMSPREVRRVTRLARKLLEELRDGDRIAVYCGDGLGEAEIATLRRALSRHGSVRLLAVTSAPSLEDIGCVRRWDDLTLLGFLDRVSPPRWARYPSVDIWLAMLRAADRMFRASTSPPGTTVRPFVEDFALPANIAAPLLWRALAAQRRGDTASATALFRAYRETDPRPEALGSEFDHQFLGSGVS